MACHESKLAEAKVRLIYVNAVICLYEAQGTFLAYMSLNRLLTRAEMVAQAVAALMALGKPMATPWRKPAGGGRDIRAGALA